MSKRYSAVNLRKAWAQFCKTRALILDQSILTFLPDGITVCGVRSQADDGGAQPRALTIGITHLSPCNEFDITPLPHPKQICTETCLCNNTHSEEQICLQSHCKSLKWPKIYWVNQDTKCRNTGVHSYIVKICICIHKTTLRLHNSVHLQQSPRSIEKQTASHRCIVQRRDHNKYVISITRRG